MTDQDYIKAAVELADGWEITKSEFGTIMIVPPFLTPDYEGLQGWSLEFVHQGIIDALAAQLRRQCRKIDKWVDVQVRMLSLNSVDDYKNHDEAMYDIRAIVDSEVLK